MNLEADQAVQEARFAGACQDQHAGRPAPNLGWPGERKSIVQQAETSVVSRNETNQAGFCRGLGPRAWGWGLQALGPKKKPSGGRQAKGWETAETAAKEVGAWREAGTGYPPYPPLPRVYRL